MKRPNPQLPDHIAAGLILKDRVLHQEITLSRWADKHSLGIRTIHDLANGCYNNGSGISVELLWRIALELTDNDVEQARYFVLEYLSSLGVLPPVDDARILARLAGVERELFAVRRACRHKRRSDNHQDAK